jgi:thiosulfate/3-mercaptopyruvate sulfurtransferase
VYFDINGICDRNTTLPHMLPSAEEFAAAAGAMGISNDTRVIVYDSNGLRYAPRVWWTFRVFGHDNVAVLDGGLPKWMAEGRAVESGKPSVERRKFEARFRPELVRNKEQIWRNIETRNEQVIDARSQGRFEGSAPETWPGRRSGHIPGALNVPFNELADSQSNTVLSAEQLKAQYERAGVDFNAPIVASCGSGVTACVLAYGLHLLGRSDVSVYDGSWAEWGLPGDTPVETGPARK